MTDTHAPKQDAETETTLETSSPEVADNDSDDVEEDTENDDELGEDDDEPVLPEEAGSVTALETPMPSLEPVPVTGIFHGLALLAEHGTLIFAIAKLKDGQLRVTVQPTPAKDEPASTAIPIVVVGTPDELETTFVRELSAYAPARAYAVASAAAIVAQTKAAADAARNKPRTSPTTKLSPTAHGKAPVPTAPTGPKKGFGFLTITTTPDDAIITVADERGKKHTFKSGVKTEVALGKATVTATRDKHKTRLSTVNVTIDGATLELDLPETANLPLLA